MSSSSSSSFPQVLTDAAAASDDAYGQEGGKGAPLLRALPSRANKQIHNQLANTWTNMLTGGGGGN